MINQTALSKRGSVERTPNVTLKATSLLYLQEALYKEQFESCPELIQTAKDFGAKQSEISVIIAEYVRGVKAGRQYGANRVSRNRLKI